jgi:hypothetical protein
MPGINDTSDGDSMHVTLSQEYRRWLDAHADCARMLVANGYSLTVSQIGAAVPEGGSSSE